MNDKAKDLVMLEYAFIFEPSNTWQTLSQFEDDLAKFFAEEGKQAQVISPIGGYKGRKIILITQQNRITPPPINTAQPGKPGAIQKNLNKMKGGK